MSAVSLLSVFQQPDAQTPAAMDLGPDDAVALDQLDRKQDCLRTAVEQLVQGYDCGLFVWGEGGIGKSHIVGTTLKELGANYVQHNSRMTARGLVEQLEERPSCIHWLEDVETLFADKHALGVLRSACWSQSDNRPPEREISWGVHRSEDSPGIRFMFTGGILVISNANLADSSSELRAVKSRIKVINMDLTADESFARSKDICSAGYRYGKDELTPGECWQVLSYIRETRPHNTDLRLLMNGFRDYLFWKNNTPRQSWQELLEMRMMERPTESAYKTRAQRTGEESAIAKELHALGLSSEETLRRWDSLTGKSRPAYYRALRK